MRHFATIVGFCIASLPAFASAQPVRIVGHNVSAEGVRLTLRAPGSHDEPRVRRRSQLAKIWVDAEGSVGRFELRRSDGQPYSVDVRPGANSTVAIRIRAPFPIEADTLRIDRSGDNVEITVTAPSASREGREQGKATATTAAKPEQPGTARQPAARAPQTDPPVPADGKARKTPEPQPDRAFLQTASEAPNTEDAAEESASPVTSLLWVTAFLALSALVLRMRKGGKGSLEADPDIRVVGRKHLGPRHQLVVVRALGEDHLLSVQGGRVERLKSTATGTPASLNASTPQRPATAPEPQKPASRQRLRLLLDRAENDESPENTGTFSGQLKKLVDKLDNEPQREAESSPAVRGLQELRRNRAS